MYLSRIRMHGFKSFSNNTTIELRKGTTAVVGPNGCGKTNVADAVRWVLGEQKMRSLRSEKLEDVIFHGTGKRKSQGMAEVEIVLSEASGLQGFGGEELSIMRRAFRDGTSKFFINRNPVRLKDIIDILLDSGLGPGGYAVIEGKMIESILLASPEERRAFFEESAGVGRYKLKRKSAVRKLEEVQENLLRLGDIVAEVEKNVRSLKYQVGRAKRYMETKEKWKKAVIILAVLKAGMLDEEEKSLEAEKKRLEDERVSIQAGISTLDAAYESAKLRERKSEEILSDYSARLRDEARNLQKIESEIDLAKERKKSAEENIERLNKEAMELQKGILSAGNELSLLKQEKVEVGTGLKEVKKKLAELGGKKTILEEKLRKARQVAVDAGKVLEERTKRSRDLQSRIAGLEAVIKSGGKRLESARNELTDLEDALKELRVSGDKSREETKRIEGELEELEKSFKDFSLRKEMLEKEKQLIKEKFNSASLKEKQLNNSLSLLIELEKKREGLWKGTSKALDLLQGNLGTVASHIDAPPDIAGTLDVSAADELQAVVIENGSSIAEIAERALREKWGATVLFCQDLVAPGGPRIREEFTSVPRTVSNLVKVDVDGVEKMFDRFLLVDNVTEALGILRSHGFNGIIMTRDGITFHPEGTVFIPGSMNSENSTGLLERKKRIDRERSSLNETRKLLEFLRKEKDRINAGIESMDKKRAEVASGISKLQSELMKGQADSLKIAETVSKTRSRIDALEDMMRETAAETASAENTLSRIRVEYEKSKTEDDETALRLSEAESEIEEIRPELTFLLDRKSVMDSEAARLDERLRTIVRDIERLTESMVRDEKNLERKRAGAGEAIETVEEMKKEISSLEERFENAVREEERRAADHRKAEEAWRLVRTEIQDIQKSLRESRARLNLIQQKIHNLEISITEKRMEINQVYQSLVQETGVSREEIEIDEEDMENDPAALEKERERLQKIMNRIGIVGSFVMEQFREESERLEFLKNQRDDLLGAREKLLETIEKINEDARIRFVEFFTLMRKNFSDVFSTIFEGGKADIIMNPSEDPLEAWIEIVAQPSGKRYQRLSLLSSGEKALTALSLLFAAFLCKPSPFCILDEVDAPLDDANVDRLLRLLEKFRENTQFIIISHNKITIKSADRIIGVTMQEPGVSSVVGVNLQSIDEVLGAGAGGKQVPVGRKNK